MFIRTIVTEVLGDLQFNFYHRWFDVTFLVSALVTIGILKLAHKRDIETADSGSSNLTGVDIGGKHSSAGGQSYHLS